MRQHALRTCFTSSGGEMQRQVQYGFSILLSTEYDVRLFREKLKFSCIAAVPQAHCRPCLILNLSDQPNKETSSFETRTGPYSGSTSQIAWRMCRKSLPNCIDSETISLSVVLLKLGVSLLGRSDKFRIRHGRQ